MKWDEQLSSGKQYLGLKTIEGPLVVVEGIHDVGWGELVHLEDAEGKVRWGNVLDTSRGVAVVQVFEGTYGLSLEGTRSRFLGEPLRIPVSKSMLGRAYDGLGRPVDEGPATISENRWDINGFPINPTARDYPRKCIQTGISAIDGMNTLVRGQKLPIFSGSGLPHNRLVAQIARQASIPGEEHAQFAVVFAALGIKHDVARYFIDNFESCGVLENVVLFLNLADDPAVERIITPRAALTAAEYLAFELGMHVLVIMTDMTNYCESLREVSTVRGEIPSRKGYPGYCT